MSNLFEQSSRSNLYDSNYTDHLQDAKNKFYKEQKENALMMNNTNIATLYSRQFNDNKFSNESIGPITNNFKNHPTSFESQFNLYKFDKKKDKPNAINEGRQNEQINPYSDNKWSNVNDTTDMTYGVVSNEDFVFENMVPFTKSRDRIIDDNNPYISRSLSIFTGVGLKENKKEIEPFFSPLESKIEGPIDSTNELIRDRYNTAVGIKKQSERLFEPEQVGPGIGIDGSLQNLGGFHDDTRILPPTSNQLRNATNPQVSYTPQINPGKLGDYSTSSAQQGQVRKYRPEQFIENNPNDILVGRAQVSRDLAPQNYIMKDTARVDFKELIGNANSLNISQYNPNTQGNIQDSSRHQFLDYIVKPVNGANRQNAQGADNYNIAETQRQSTNDNYIANCNNSSINQNKSQFSDIAKGTDRQNVNVNYQGNIGNSQQNVQNQLNDLAKSTDRQNVNVNYQGNVGSGQQNVQNHLNDLAKGTDRQQYQINNNGNLHGSSYGTAINYQDDAKGTIRQLYQINNNGNIQAHSYSTTSNYQDNAKSTDRQLYQINNNGNAQGPTSKNMVDLQDEAKSTIRQLYQINNNGNAQGPTTKNMVDLQDEAKSTIRQLYQINNNGNAQGPTTKNMVDLQDEARSTIKQDTMLKDYLGQGQGPTTKNMVDLQDEARSTIKQDTMLKNYLGQGQGPTTKNTVDLQDEARSTIKQDTMIKNYLGQGQGPTTKNMVDLQDEARSTIKQDTMVKNHMTSLGSSSLAELRTYLQDEARSTIKQDTMINNYKSNVNNSTNIKTRTRTDIANMETSDGRETIAKQRAPTWKGFAETPSAKLLNVELKNMPQYTDPMIPDKSNDTLRFNFQYDLKRNDVQQTNPIFDNNFIDIMGDSLKSNSLVNNLIYKGNQNSNSTTFFYNQS